MNQNLLLLSISLFFITACRRTEERHNTIHISNVPNKVTVNKTNRYRTNRDDLRLQTDRRNFSKKTVSSVNDREEQRPRYKNTRALQAQPDNHQVDSITQVA